MKRLLGLCVALLLGASACSIAQIHTTDASTDRKATFLCVGQEAWRKGSLNWVEDGDGGLTDKVEWESTEDSSPGVDALKKLGDDLIRLGELLQKGGVGGP